MQPSVFFRAALLCGVLSFTCAAGWADILPPNQKPVEHTYEIVNLAQYQDYLIVVYPFICDSSGTDLADTDLSLNPQLRFYPDYEVLRPSTAYPVTKFCPDVALHALPAARVRTLEKGDVDIGPYRPKGKPFLAIREVEALTINQRRAFFNKNPRVLNSDFRLHPIWHVDGGSPLRAIHEELLIDRLDREGFRLRGHRVTYHYDDGQKEILAFVEGRRPPPSREKAPPKAPPKARPGASPALAAALPEPMPMEPTSPLVSLGLAVAACLFLVLIGLILRRNRPARR
jgi:hypothetical protein